MWGTHRTMTAETQMSCSCALIYLINAGCFSQVDSFPAVHKGSQGEIHVFNSGSALPATNSNNGLAAPDASCSIEVEEATSGKLDILLTFAVKVQRDLLGL